MPVIDITQVDPKDIQSGTSSNVKKTAPPPKSGIWENIKNRRFSAESPIDTDIKNTVIGAFDTAKTAIGAVEAIDPFSLKSMDERKEALGKAATGAKEIVKAPARALMGRQQPGQPPESAPKSITGRLAAAADVAVGGDPGEVKMRYEKGDYLGAASAAVTGPLLMRGLREVLPEKPSTIGPKPAPQLRKPFPATEAVTWRKEAVERLQHPGQYLPATEDRVAKIAESIPGSDPRDIAQVLPELDKTIADPKYAVAPKGPVETTSIEKRPSNRVQENETLGSLMTNTMKRLQERWNNDILGPFRYESASLTPVANDLRNLQKSGLVNFEAAAGGGGSVPATDPGAYVKRLQDLETAVRGVDLSIQDIDDLRQYYFSLDDASAKGRIAPRSSADAAADRAIENSLRKIEYDHLESRLSATGGDPTQVRYLKGIQRKLYSIGDVNTKTSASYLSQDAIERGYNFAKKHDITAAVHPKTLMPVVAAHGMARGEKPGTPAKAQKQIKRAFAVKGEPVGNTEKAAAATGRIVANAAPTAVTGRIPNREGQRKTTSPPATSNKAIKMRAPNGDTQDIPADQVEHYKSLGAQVVQ